MELAFCWKTETISKYVYNTQIVIKVLKENEVGEQR
jgi:hypothetical protein